MIWHRLVELVPQTRYRTIFIFHSIRLIIFLENGIMYSLTEESGQGLTEYALILLFVAMVVIIILILVGPVVGNVFSKVINGLPA